MIINDHKYCVGNILHVSLFVKLLNVISFFYLSDSANIKVYDMKSSFVKNLNTECRQPKHCYKDHTKIWELSILNSMIKIL